MHKKYARVQKGGKAMHVLRKNLYICSLYVNKLK